jgi:hypothetical protein
VTEDPEEPAGRQPGRPPRAARLQPPRLPLWGRWVLSLSVGVVLIIALVAFVTANDADRPTADNTQVTAESNREARALIAEDQAPHVSPLPAGSAPARAMTMVITAYMRRMIGRGTIGGPLTSARCSAARASGRTRRGFRCAAVAASVKYPFIGVVDQRTRRVTYCKNDPLGPAGPVPVSPRCRP